MDEKQRLEQALEKTIRYRKELQRMIAELEALEDGMEDAGVLRRLRMALLDLECTLDSVEDLATEAVSALGLEWDDIEWGARAN